MTVDTPEHLYNVALEEAWRIEMLEDPALAARVAEILRRDFADLHPTPEELQQLEFLAAAQDLLATQLRDFAEWWGPTIRRLRGGVIGRAEADQTGAGYEFLREHWEPSNFALAIVAEEVVKLLDEDRAGTPF
jgi:hypothetical protein